MRVRPRSSQSDVARGDLLGFVVRQSLQATLEVRLRARLTGQVVASTFKTDSTAGSASIELYTGVGELGIPLSPASLVLPRFTERLAAPWNDIPDDELLRANVRLLGLAYSLAVAPPAMVLEKEVFAKGIYLVLVSEDTFDLLEPEGFRPRIFPTS